jgi:hypothetical protein
MDRRKFRRVSAKVKLVLFEGGLPVAIGRVSNAGSVGFFVETEFTDAVLKQALELELPLRVGSAMQNFRFTAQVVHRAANGFGMSIEQSDEQAKKALFMLLSNCLLDEPSERKLVTNA